MSAQCPKCSAENPDTKQFCGDCGTNLSGEISAPTKTIETPIEKLSTGTTFVCLSMKK